MKIANLAGPLLSLTLFACSSDWEVEGVVVDEEGRPLVAVPCTLTPGTMKLLEDGAHVDSTFSDEAGRFSLRADPALDAMWFSCGLDDRVYHAARVSRDDGEQRVVLRRAGAIEGTVRLDEGFSTEPLSVRLDGGSDWREVGFLNGWVPADVDPSGRLFSLVPLPPGVVTVSVGASELGDDGFAVPIAEVDGVVVRAGETTTVPEIDLRGLCKQIEVRAVGPSGEPLEGFYLWERDVNEDGEPDWAMNYVEDGVCRFLFRLDAPPLLDARVTSGDLRTARLGDVTESVVARLEPALRVRVRLEPMPKLESGEELHLVVDGPDCEPDAEAIIDADGEAELLLTAPGDWSVAVRLTVSKRSRGLWVGVPRDAKTVSVRDVAEQEIALSLPGGGLGRFIERARERSR